MITAPGLIAMEEDAKNILATDTSDATPDVKVIYALRVLRKIDELTKVDAELSRLYYELKEL